MILNLFIILILLIINLLKNNLIILSVMIPNRVYILKMYKFNWIYTFLNTLSIQKKKRNYNLI
jgi:hypothetical protein